MKANEIRVGNWIKDPRPFNQETKKFFKMTENGYFKATARDIQFAEEFEPIPLTEGILLKCGFKKSRNIGCYDTDKDAFFFESDKISLTIDFILSSSNHYYRSNPVDGAIPLKYLHQLQNLVFSVTGQELEINL